MTSDSLLFAEKITSMIITKIPYAEIRKELEDTLDSNQSLEWGEVGRRIVAITVSGEHEFFIRMNLLDFAMQAFEADGEDSTLEKSFLKT